MTQGRGGVLDDVYGADEAQTSSSVLDDVFGFEPMVAKPIRAAPPTPATPPPAPMPIKAGRFDRFGEPLNDAAAVEDAAIRRRAEAEQSPFQRTSYDIARGVTKAALVDLPVGTFRFLTSPLRAVFAPETVEEARNPLVRATKVARGGARLDELEAAVHRALIARAEGAQTPAEVVGEAARGLVTSGYDLERAAIEAEGPEAKARAIANLGLFGGLLAHGAATERAAAIRNLEPVPAADIGTRVAAALRGEKPVAPQGPLTAEAAARAAARAANRPPTPMAEIREPNVATLRPPEPPAPLPLDFDAVASEARTLSLLKERTPEQQARLRELSATLRQMPVEPPPPLEESNAALPGVPEELPRDMIERELARDRRQTASPVEAERRVGERRAAEVARPSSALDEVYGPPEPGAPRDQAAVQEGLFGEKTLQGSEQTSLLPENAGVPPAAIEPTRITTPEEVARVRREGSEPPGERPAEMFPTEAQQQLARHAELTRLIARDEQVMGAGTYESTFTDENAHIGQPGQKFVRTRREGSAYAAAGRLAQARKRLARLERAMDVQTFAEARQLSEGIASQAAQEANRKLNPDVEAQMERAGIVSEGEPVDAEALFSPANARTPLGWKIRRAAGVATPPPADVPALINISRKLAEAVGVPLRQGRFNAGLRRALGVFKPHEEVTRVTRYDKLDTVAHEVGHYVSKKYLRNPTMRSAKVRGVPRLPRGAVRELVQMGKDLYGNRKPAGGYGEEGIAEWHKFYVADPAALAAKAPEFTRHMEGVLAQEPALKAALDQAREDVTRYQASPANARIGAMLSVNERVRNVPTVRSLMRAWLDDVYEFKAAVQELGGAASPAKDAGVLARLTRGSAGMAEEMLERGVVRYGTRERAAGSVEEALHSIPPERIKEFREYLTAESALDRLNRGIDPGFARADVQEVAERGRADAVLSKAAQTVWDHYRALIEYRRDAGLLTDKQARLILEANPHHVAFYRKFAEEERPGYGPGGGRGYARVSTGVKRQHGSAREIIDPLESVFTDTYQTVAQVKKYEVARELVKLARSTEGGGRIIEEVPAPKRRVAIPVGRVLDQLSDLGLVYEGVDAKTGQRFTAPLGGLGGAELEGLLTSFEDARFGGAAEAKDLIVPLIEKGETRFYAVKDRALYDAMQGLGTPEISGLMRWLSAPVRTLRAGATLTLEFAFGRNPIRDAWTSAVYSKAGFRVPGVGLAEGLFHYLKADDAYKAWRLEGGDNAAMLGLDRVHAQQTLTKLMHTRTLAGKVVNLVRHPLDTLRLVSSIMESATRLGEFAAVERRALAEGATPESAGKTAALASRDVTVDFAQGGTASKALNQIIWTFNASLRGSAQLLRELRTRPGTVVPRALALITLPSIALYLMQRDDPEYQDMPAWVRNTSWVWIQRDRAGKVVHRWIVPKPFELGVLFGTVPERIVEWIDRRNPAAIRHMTDALTQAFVPPVVPTAVVPIVENYANRSLFRGRPIVPRGKEDLPAGEQAAPFTGETARVIGRALGYSPAKIENLVRGYTGGLGTTALQGTDAALRGLTGAPGPVERPGDVLSNVPLIRAFVRRNVADDAEIVEELYRNFTAAEGHRRAWRAMLADGRGAEAAAYLRAHGDDIRRVATTEETGGTPGPLRVAYETIQQLQQIKRQVEARGAPERRQMVTDAMRRLARGQHQP